LRVVDFVRAPVGSLNVWTAQPDEIQEARECRDPADAAGTLVVTVGAR